MSPSAAAALSAALPGAGQLALGLRDRGLAILAVAISAVAVMVWLGQPAAWLAVLPFWVVQTLDAAALARSAKPGVGRLIALGVLPFYLAGWQATEASPRLLATGLPRAMPLFRELLTPDLLTRESLADVSMTVRVLTPCPPGGPPERAAPEPGAPTVSVSPACAPLGAALAVRGAGLEADRPVQLTWVGPTGERSRLAEARTDGDGAFEVDVVVPVSSIPQHVRERMPDHPQSQAVVATVPGPPGPLRPSDTLRLVLSYMAVTVALGYVATVLGALLALPIAVLGARNLMADAPLGTVVYVAARTFMNVLRSIEPLILAVVFVVWVGQGPFAGALALTAHSVAALGKLFSESIEEIDEGPVEAVRATGASWLQTVVYAVAPQVVPAFTAFTVYRWDINVRMSTILGFVGGGGIGFLLQQWIFKSRWSEAAVAVLVIAVVVMLLDFASASVRDRIVSGRKLLPARGRLAVGVLLTAGLVLFTAWAWTTVRFRPDLLALQASKIRPIAMQLASPRLITYDRESETVSATLAVPCSGETGWAGTDGAIEPAGAATASSPGGSLQLPSSCANVGDWLVVRGSGLRPEARARLAWALPDGRELPVEAAVTDADGALEAELEVRPILAGGGATDGSATVALKAEISWPVGYPRPSEQLRVTIGALIQTVLMALMATTAGAVIALPLGLLGARNIMPSGLAGDAVYYGTRTALNVLRSIEPLILAAVFAAWVGYGVPFAGVLAITLVTVANLGKLFSEAVEDIDPGPLDAIEATGAGRLQSVVYAVLPQIIPPYLSFGIYQWDINVRISTVIGFVGGGGIGLVLQRWMNLTDWRAASVAILGIVVVVSVMDFVSGLVRERVRVGSAGARAGAADLLATDPPTLMLSATTTDLGGDGLPRPG
ncbi:MAG: phosphonate ABC transporter, permease protein PhnE [Anaerolineae bacterium]